MEPSHTSREPEPRVGHEIRIGTVMALIRTAPSNTGQPELTVVLRRVDSGLTRLRAETVLSRDELLLAARALDQAHSFICRAQG
jgi:hypothetical protein